jgi:DNA-binding GntR family transcriptional regulator
LPIRVVSVVDAVADDLRALVLRGQLSAGDGLTETEVATRYGVARPTAKAAIEKLVSESLLRRTNHKTARVVRLNAEDVRDIYRTRGFLERGAIRKLADTRHVPAGAVAANQEIVEAGDASSLAIIEPDMRFHTSLVDALESDRTSKIYHGLVSEVKLCMLQLQGQRLLSPAVIAADHQSILDHIAAGDEEGAVTVLDQHLERARDRLVSAVQELDGAG